MGTRWLSGRALALIAVPTLVVVGVGLAIAGQHSTTALLAGVVAAVLTVLGYMLAKGMMYQRDRFSRRSFLPVKPWRLTDVRVPANVSALLEPTLGRGHAESVAWATQRGRRIDILSWAATDGVHRPVFHIPLDSGLPPFTLEPIQLDGRYVMQADDDDPAEVDALEVGPFDADPGAWLSDGSSVLIVCPYTTGDGVNQFINYPFDEILAQLIEAEEDFIGIHEDAQVQPPNDSSPPPTPTWDAPTDSDYSTLTYDDQR